MRKVTEYRRVAEECRQMAAEMANVQHKKTLEDAAQTWEQFAQDRQQRLDLEGIPQEQR
jgi:hypothetical protein